MDVLETLALLVFASSEDLGLAYQALDAFHAIQEFQAYLEWGAWMDLQFLLREPCHSVSGNSTAPWLPR